MDELTYHRLLLPRLGRSGDKVAFHHGGRSRTFSEHFDRVFRVAGACRAELGLRRCDAFAVVAYNSLEFVELWHAAYLGAGVITPVNWRLSRPEMAHVLADCGASVVFTDSTFAPLVDELRPDLPAIEQVVVLDGGSVPGDQRYEDLVGAAEHELPGEPREDDPVVTFYTAGTTGRPKGVVHTQRTQVLGFYRMYMTDRYVEDDVVLTMTPMFHRAGAVGALVAPPVGAATVAVDRFDAGEVMDVIEALGVTRALLIPTALSMLFDHPSFRPERLASLRRITYGGSPMPEGTLERAREALPLVGFVQNYGMTESGSPVTVLGAAEHARGEHLGSVGRPVPGADVSIRDSDGEPLPIGSVGEVCVRIGSLMAGYRNQPDLTERVLRGGWYHSGDLGYVDGDGYLYVVDRVDDMIITGGENVYSLEVERALLSHPAVAQVAVVGRPHPVWGEAVHATVVVEQGVAVSGEDLRRHAASLLADYKVPKTFDFTDRIELSGALKPLKHKLRRAGVTS